MDALNLLKTQAEQVELLTVKNENTSVVFEANKFKTSTVDESSGLAVRVIRNGKLGFTASTDGASVNKLVANSLESAAYGEKISMDFPPPQPAKNVRTFDPTITSLPILDLVDMGKQIVDLILPVEPDAQCNITIRRSIQSSIIRNQNGLDLSFQRSPLTIDVEIDRIIGDDVLLLFDTFATTVWDPNYLGFVSNLAEKLRLSKNIVPFKGGRMPVLFTPTGMLVMGLPINEGLNGKNVYKGTSPLAGKVGQKLFDEKISLVDDGTLDGKVASAPYDDEGVPHRRINLIEKGELKGFLFDLKTAAQYGVETTGNADRTLFTPPEPASTNVIFQAGNAPLKDILAGIDEGVLVDNVLGLGQGNIISGAFSNPLSLAFKIEKGKVIGRIKHASIAGNIYELLKNVAAVSQEAEWVYRSFYAPYVLLPEMTIVAEG